MTYEKRIRNNLSEEARVDLLRDLIKVMGIDAVADELNNQAYDWGVFPREDDGTEEHA